MSILRKNVELSAALYRDLGPLARKVGMTTDDYIREILIQHLEDMQDIEVAERVIEDIRAGREETVPAEEVFHDLAS